MDGSQVTGGYSSSFWMNKLINLIAVLASVWLILWVADEEQDPERSIAKVILYLFGFILASIAVWNALKFVFNWQYDETRMVEDKTSADEEESSDVDDLTEIEGIGPKINDLLVAAGIESFSDLADADTSDIKDILTDAGDRYKMHDPSSWPQQAQLAAEGEWAKLHSLQEELNGGKKK